MMKKSRNSKNVVPRTRGPLWFHLQRKTKSPDKRLRTLTPIQTTATITSPVTRRPTPVSANKTRKHRKPPTVVSSDSDLDDDQLGITPRTLPQSPFYRGPTSRVAATKTPKKNVTPTTTTAHNRQCKNTAKQVLASPQTQQEPQAQEQKRKKAPKLEAVYKTWQKTSTNSVQN